MDDLVETHLWRNLTMDRKSQALCEVGGLLICKNAILDQAFMNCL